MAKYPLASIAEADYPEIHKICEGRIPATYTEWYWEREANSGQEGIVGHQIVLVSMTPDELQQYCEQKSTRGDGMTLQLFAEQKFADRRG